jgi:hypothetical protein
LVIAPGQASFIRSRGPYNTIGYDGKYCDRVSNIKYEAMKDAGAGAGRCARVSDTTVEMLRISGIFECRDDQDLVYALLDMSEEAVEFRVDYRESVESTFLRLAQKDLFLRNDHICENAQPSYVPDWRAGPSSTVLGRWYGSVKHTCGLCEDTYVHESATGNQVVEGYGTTLNAVRVLVRGRCFVLNEDAPISLAPCSAKEGDVVVVLKGAETPFVLRRTVDEVGVPGSFWIGECYIHASKGSSAHLSRLHKFALLW